ncbi:MAG: DUF6338 family protein [Bacteroidales bacterium]|nr:DUF6338 family protein [Bacteroidales bacterium]
MPDISEPNIVYAILGLLVPGVVITFMRSQFTTGRMQKHSDALLSYFVLSIVYWALVLPFYLKITEMEINRTGYLYLWFSIIFIGPALFGAIIGMFIKTDAMRKLLHHLRINPVHAIPSAWEWKFYNMGECLILVTLKDDTKFAGYCGKRSFFSSDPLERDLYIEKIYSLGENYEWRNEGEHGVLIKHDEVKTIEFFPVDDANT